jgi:hypothetical protein
VRRELHLEALLVEREGVAGPHHILERVELVLVETMNRECAVASRDDYGEIHGSGLGRQRWVVERTFAWLHNRRRLLVRTDRRDDIHEGFLALTCCLICWRQLETSLS